MNKVLAHRVSALFAWSAVIVVAAASFFSGQHVVVKQPLGITAWLLGATPTLVIGLALLPWAQSRAALWQRSWWAVAAFAGLIAWAAARAVGVERCIVRRDGVEIVPVCYPDWVAWVPLLQSIVTMGLAWVLVAAIPRRRLNAWLAAVATTVVAMTGIALVRALVHPRGFNRLGSGLGGAAVLSVALVIAAASLMGWFVEKRTRWVAVVGAAAAAMIALTFSRSGIAIAVLTSIWIIFLSRTKGRRPSVRIVLVLGACAAAIGGVVGLLFPQFIGRLVTLGDSARSANAAAALDLWTQRTIDVIVGVGTGRVWPWFGVDADLIWVPETGMLGVEGLSGDVLVNPHSTFLGVLVELGIVGAIPLIVLLGGVIWAASRAKTANASSFALVAAAVSVAAFMLDYYLLRNPGVSFVWWCAVFAGLSGTQRGGESQTVMGDSLGPDDFERPRAGRR